MEHMHIFADNSWQNGFLDYHRSSRELRIKVFLLKNVQPMQDLYFVRPRSLRMAWNYLFEVGPGDVFRKAMSRTAERIRNEKFVSCGLGRILETCDAERFPVNQTVVFVATCHPMGMERIVVPTDLAGVVDEGLLAGRTGEQMLLHQMKQGRIDSHDLIPAVLHGWSPYSGIVLPQEVCREALSRCLKDLRETDWSDALKLPVSKHSSVVVRTVPSSGRYASRSNGSKPAAVLFGYGNYAKTMIIPNVKRDIDIRTIHEIDPTQIPVGEKASGYHWDTSPTSRDNEEYEVYFVAGYHHTHAPLAIHALEKDACAVVEKPVVTNFAQLEDLVAAMERSSGRIFVGLHKRYSPFNDLARRDLNAGSGAPISCHCIVFEAPLPARHWYNWPTSRSRLVSNGIHWIDLFLYLNDYCDFVSYDLHSAPDGSLNCSVVLKNNALFTMVLTDRGSGRIGVQDFIELRHENATVKMVNGSHYESEDNLRIIRRKRLSKVVSHRNMYSEIGRRIRAGDCGDSVRSVLVPSLLMLNLEELYESKARMSGMPALEVSA